MSSLQDDFVSDNIVNSCILCLKRHEQNVLKTIPKKYCLEIIPHFFQPYLDADRG